MQVKATIAAIEAYIKDCSARPGACTQEDTGIQALKLLLPTFSGFSSKQFNVFKEVVQKAQFSEENEVSFSEPLVSSALPPLERLCALIEVVGSADRKRDLRALIALLKANRSVSLRALETAVQCGRRGARRPEMSIEELKANLDNSLGDEDRFARIIAELRLLSEDEFQEVAKTALRTPFKTKRQGMERLKRLHQATRSHRSKQSSTSSRSAP